jgi:L-2-hydroxyglutarate oxidase LhgO
MKQFKEFIDKYTALLPVGKSLSPTEAEFRAGEFLVAMAQITDWRHILSEQKVKCVTTQTAVYAEEMSKGTAKTVTENKMTAEASKAYTTAREDLEYLENDIAYLKAYFDIFNNAHVFYRNSAKGDNF